MIDPSANSVSTPLRDNDYSCDVLFHNIQMFG